jgi:CubicO group peptidase (beta-lactamase class C family)
MCSNNLDDPLETRLEDYIKPYVSMKDFSGTILMAHEGEILIKKSYGMANNEHDIPNTPQTKFHIASLTKSFTAILILQLVEQGALTLKSTIQNIIPDYPNGEKNTIHNLLTHTSGIPNHNEFLDYHRMSLRKHSLDNLVNWIKEKPLKTLPGSEYLYSNSNYILLSHILEQVTEYSYDNLLKINILDPLEMNDTGNYSHECITKNRANRYSPSHDGLINAPWYDMSIKMGSGSLYSTAEDLFKFDKALYTEDLISKRSLSKIYTPYIGKVGYGWFIDELYDRKVMRNNGSSPGAMAHFLRYIEDESTIIFLSNVRSGLGFFLHKDLSKILFNIAYEASDIVERVSMSDEVMDSFVGEYGNEKVNVSLFRKGDNLWYRIGNYPYEMYLMPVVGGNLFSRDRYDMFKLIKDEGLRYLEISGPGWDESVIHIYPI